MQIANKTYKLSLILAAALSCLVSAANATENSGSVWPVGAESIAIASAAPHAGQTRVEEYTCYYVANEVDDAKGHKTDIPEFKLRVFAAAVKIVHNWGIKVPFGELGSYIAVPNVYEQIHIPGAKYTNNAITNVNIVPVTIFGRKGILHWKYELEFETAGSGYQKGAVDNIGQHNIALTNGIAFTLTPHHGDQEISARFDYVVNNADHATHYHSGNEFFTQFDARQQIPHTKVGIGVIGYYYQQTTNDTQSGKAVVTTNADGTQCVGYKGRALDLGAQVSLPMGKHGGMAFKWERDTLVQNRTRGDMFWFQFGIPFSYLHHPKGE